MVSASRIADAEPFQLFAGQEPLAAMFLEFLDPAGGIGALGDNAAPAREGVHAADHRQDAIGLERRCLELAVQLRDLCPRHLVGLGAPSSGVMILSSRCR